MSGLYYSENGTDDAMVLRDRDGRQVLRLQGDGGLVVCSGFHPLDGRAFPPLNAEAIRAVYHWCERQLPSAEEAQ